MRAAVRRTGLKRARRLLARTLLLVVLAAVLLFGWTVVRKRTTLDLGEEPGMLTGRALASLAREPGRCRALLDRAGVRYAQAAVRSDGPSCGYSAGLRLAAGGARAVPLSPDEPVLTCPVVAALAMWEWSVVQPAARRLLGQPVARIEQLGSYNCRPIAGTTRWSEHATANAIDVAAFRLADGRTISVLADWRGNGPEATFLRRVRTGACDVFATVLSPDYNAAHRDHFHLDQAARGAASWRACR